jgi:hypothetical protein
VWHVSHVCHRVKKFDLPRTCTGGFFTGKRTQISAKEWRNVCLILPHLVAGLVQEAFEQAISIWSRVLAASAGRLLPIDAGPGGNRHPGITESSTLSRLSLLLHNWSRRWSSSACLSKQRRRASSCTGVPDPRSAGAWRLYPQQCTGV